jgi:hypothetical protein
MPDIFDLAAEDVRRQPQRPTSGGGDPFDLAADEIRQTGNPFDLAAQDARQPTALDTVLTSGMRIVPSIAGNLIGGALGATAGAPTGPGALATGGAGVMAGGAAGSALGDWLAQQYELSRGIRTEYSPMSTVVEAGLGAIPIKGSSRILSAMGKGGAMSGGATLAHSAFERGELPELGELLFSGGVGALTGGALHGGIKGYQYLRNRGQAADTAAAEALAEKAKAAGAVPQMADTTGQVPVRPEDVIVGRTRPDGTVTNGTVTAGGRFRPQHKPELSSPMARNLAQGELIPEVRSADPAVQAAEARKLAIRQLMRDRMAGRESGQGRLVDLNRAMRLQEDVAARLGELIGVPQPVAEIPTVGPGGPNPPATAQTQLPGATPTGRRIDQVKLPVDSTMNRDAEIAELQRQLKALQGIANEGGVLSPLPDVEMGAARSQNPVIRALADDAIENGFPGSVVQAERLAEQQARGLYDSTRVDADPNSAMAMLQRIARAGGIAVDDADIGGETRWAKEFRDEGGAINTLAGVRNIFRRTTKDIKGQRATGLSADEMATLLKGEGFPFEKGDDVLEAIAQAKRDFDAGKLTDDFDFMKYAGGAGLAPGRRWWMGESGPAPRADASEFADDADEFVPLDYSKRIPGESKYDYRVRIEQERAQARKARKAPPADDDMPDWDLPDDGQWSGEPGESGRISARLATTLGGAAAGGVSGAAAPAEDRETRMRNAAIGAFTGALGGAAAAGFATRRRPLPPGTQAPQPGVTQNPGPRTVQTARGVSIRGPKSDQGQGRRILELGGDYNLLPGEGTIRKSQLENLKLEKFPPVVRAAIADTLHRKGGFAEQRRNVRPNPLTEEAAKRLAVELDRMVPPGQAGNAEQLKAYALGLTAVNAKKIEIAHRIAADKAKGITNTDDLVELMKENADGDLLLQSLMGMRAESGRALQIQSTFNKLLPAEARILLHGSSGAKLRGELEKMAELLATVKDPVEAMKIARDNADWKPGEWATNFFMGNILSGIQTHLRNVIGTANNVATNLVVKGAVGAPLDMLQATLQGRPREVYAGEVLHDVIGLVSTMDKAMNDAWFTLRNGFSEEGLSEMLADQSQLRIARKEFGGGLQNPLNAAPRALEAMDRFFVTLNRGMTTHSRAYSLARQAADKAGVRPGSKGFADFMAKEIASQRANMTDATHKQIVKEAQEAVFRGEPGTLAKWLISGKEKMPGLNFLVPFVSTISNMHKAGYEMTPVSLAVKGIRQARGKADAFGATGRERTMTQAKGLFGTIATLPLAYLAATGRLSGAGTSDRSARDQAYERGWRPNSIKMPLPDEVATAIGAERSPDGEYWVAYNLIQPIALPASIIANGFEAWEDVQRRGTRANMEQTGWDIFSKMSTRVANSALSQSYFTGLFGAIDAINNPDQGASKFFSDLARGFVPMSGLMRNVQRAVDPVVRSPRGLIENLAAGVPGLSQTVPAQIGRFGDERQRSGNIIRRSVLVPEVEPVTADPIDLELERIGVNVGRPSDRLEMGNRRTGQRQQITPEQAQQLQVARGTAARAMLERVMQSPGYAKQPDTVKRIMVERALDAASNRTSNVARRAFMSGRPDALAALIEQSRRSSGGGR